MHEKRSLYPPIECFDSGYLQADDIHSLYYDQSGNAKGIPVVFLHGGPGGGCGPKHRQYFDPAHYRIIIFDQRGAGKSKPYGEIRQNTTELLVSDLEKLRQYLGIEKWHVFGGSWGSTLALAYALAHPDRVHSLTLRGIFLMTGAELDWFLYGLRAMMPEKWEAFANYLPEKDRGDILNAYYRLLTNPDPEVHLKAAKSWASYESDSATLLPRPADPEHVEDLNQTLAIARMEAHYFLNNRFKPDDYLIQNVGKIRNIPAVIVQGRYDLICPPETAYRLHKAWPEAKFILVPDAGHSSAEPGTMDALIRATDDFRRIAT
jgi:proline iminopeptidase